MTHGTVWAVIIGCIILLIIYGIVSSKLKTRRLRRVTKELLPEVIDHIQVGRNYLVVLNSGSRLEGVQFVGLSKTAADPEESLPFPLQRWVILQRPSGKRTFVKPESIRYYEEM